MRQIDYRTSSRWVELLVLILSDYYFDKKKLAEIFKNFIEKKEGYLN
jgi:hypothetical protein